MEDHGKTNWKNRLIAMALATFSTVSYSATSLFIKMFGKNGDPWILTLVRCLPVGVFGAILIVLDWKKITMPGKKEMIILLIRGLSTVPSYIFIIYGIKQLPLSDVLTIVSAAPVVVAIIGCGLNRKLCDSLEITMVILSTIGVVLCVQPGFIFHNISYDPKPVMPYLMCASVPLVLGIGLHLIRSVNHLHIGIIILVPSLTTCIPIATYCYIADKFQYSFTNMQLICITGVSLSSVGSVYFQDLSLKFDSATICSVVRSLEIVLAFVYDITIFHFSPSVVTICGSTLVIIGIFVPGIIKYIAETRTYKSIN
ncbi:Uncharacterised protein at_DN0541 [Pycnogonum litorale]